MKDRVTASESQYEQKEGGTQTLTLILIRKNRGQESSSKDMQTKIGVTNTCKNDYVLLWQVVGGWWYGGKQQCIQ